MRHLPFRLSDPDQPGMAPPCNRAICGRSLSRPPVDGKLTSMTVPMASSGGQQPGDKRDAPDSAKGESTLAERLLAILTAVLALAAFIWSFPALRNNVIKGFALAGLLLFLLALDRARKAIKSKKLTKSVALDIACVAALCVCGSVVIVNVLSTSNASLRSQVKSAVEIGTPAAPLAGEPPTSIGCPQTISGTDSVPPGYRVAIGFKFVHSSTWVFQAVGQSAGNWTLRNVDIQQYPGSGTLVDLVAIVINASSLNYYLDTFQQAANGATWWDSNYLPPDTLSRTSLQLAELPSLNKPKVGYCWRPHV
jgi:hypothetical protein